ncbi:hypothetical protein E2C01_003868 [Portunus trituberculatus]|uniref:Uncharacterized protein n=1 Tax=Portunus trituberculatus TaxID=210409 RepID=A0A5B7CPY2_PORTR|nr:hypothetical protein [Portunus trituberculatus]
MRQNIWSAVAAAGSPTLYLCLIDKADGAQTDRQTHSLLLLGLPITAFPFGCSRALQDAGYSFDDGGKVLLDDALVFQARKQHQEHH